MTTDNNVITFKDRALACVSRGFDYVIPLRPESKIAFLNNWQNLGTNSPEIIERWNQQNPNFNCGVVFKAVLGAQWALETDSSQLAKHYEEETGKKFPKTLTVQSRVGRGHRFYTQTPASIEMNNIGQGDADGFSVRCNDEYCVSMLSVHPDTKTLYKVVVDTPIVPAPDDFVAWLVQQRKSKTPIGERSLTWMDDPIPEGTRDTMLAKIAGKLRHDGLDADSIYAVLSAKNQKQCIPPKSDEDIKRITNSISRYEVGKTTVRLDGKPLDGPDAALWRQEQAETAAAIATAVVQAQAAADVTKWPEYFKAVGELDEGDVRMLISGFLPEGTTFIGALPGVGKTLIGLSMARALTTGKSFLGSFEVPDLVPVIYLIPESSGRAFRSRCEKFKIPNDRNLFLCRTISEGTTLLLDDPILKEAVRTVKPAVFLDTAIRFSQSNDENSASQNKRLADNIIALRQAGAIGVIALHHSTKASRAQEMTLENVLRGTGDIAALPDAVYGLSRDDVKYDNNRGPNEIDVVCVKPRDFEPPAPFRIAATYKKEGVIFPVSYIDETGDFKMIDSSESLQNQDASLVKLIQEFPAITIKELEAHTGAKSWRIQKKLQDLGWVKPRGNVAGGSKWIRSLKEFGAPPSPLSLPAQSVASGTLLQEPSLF